MQLPLTCFWLFFWTVVGVGSLSFSWCHIGPLAIEVASSVLVMGEPVMTSFPRDSIEKAVDCLGKQDDRHPSNGLSCSHQESREDFAGDAVNKNLPANANGSIPGSRKIPHAVDQLNLCVTSTEPLLSSPQAATPEAHLPRAQAPQQEKPLQWEDHAPQQRVAPAHYS